MSMTNSNNIQLESQEHFNLNEQPDPSLLSLTELFQLKKGNFLQIISWLTAKITKKEKFIENVFISYQRPL